MVKAANRFNHLEFRFNHLELDWDAPIWAPMFQEVAHDRMFVRYGERGNSMSEALVEDISFEAFVSDLEAVVDALGVDRFSFVGPVARLCDRDRICRASPRTRQPFDPLLRLCDWMANWGDGQSD